MATDLQVTLHLPWEKTVEHLTAALKEEGFGIVSSLAMHEIFKNKLGVDFRPYLILGVCNPAFALRVLDVDSRGGMVLPCTVTVESIEEGGTRVSVGDPETSFVASDLSENPAIRAVAVEARQRLERVVRKLHAVARGERAFA